MVVLHTSAIEGLSVTDGLTTTQHKRRRTDSSEFPRSGGTDKEWERDESTCVKEESRLRQYEARLLEGRRRVCQ